MDNDRTIARREFLAKTGAVATGSIFASSLSSLGANAQSQPSSELKRVALVGTGIRGTSLWGRTLRRDFGDVLEFVGLCDINPGRLAYAKEYMGVDCPTFTDFDQMLDTVKPDAVIVTTVDATHHEFIIKALDKGCVPITEKPMTTDEHKCQAILDAEKRSGLKAIVGFNYRYGVHYTAIKKLLHEKRVGDIVSVDFHWYLNTSHGASYFRRWHGIRSRSGTLLCHKATHHFDLLNWWLDSEPEEVHAYGDLEFYGKNNAFRSAKCRGCPHQSQCDFFWDITRDQRCMDLYVANEHHDGYIRDACLFRPEIDIYDKMAVQIKYANNVFVSYSLTTYSPYEGWRIGFNGTKGRFDSWAGIPWQAKESLSQEQLHQIEMDQNYQETRKDYNEIMVMDNFGDYSLIKVPQIRGGHGGGDAKLLDDTFRYPDREHPYRYRANSRDGAMSILIGVAARKSIEEKRPVKIGELTELKPKAQRPS